MGWFDEQDAAFLDPNDPRIRSGGLIGVPTPQGRLGYDEAVNQNAYGGGAPVSDQPTTAQANTDLLTSLDDATLAGYTPEHSTPEWWRAVQGEIARRKSAASGAPAGLSPTRQRIWDNFHSAQNKNPIRDPNETDLGYWEALYNWPGMDPAYLDQRMFDPEGQGSNAGHFVGGPQSFAQMAGMPYSPAPMNPYQAPPPSFGRPAPNFAQMAPPPVPFVPYPQGRR